METNFNNPPCIFNSKSNAHFKILNLSQMLYFPNICLTNSVIKKWNEINDYLNKSTLSFFTKNNNKLNIHLKLKINLRQKNRLCL